MIETTTNRKERPKIIIGVTSDESLIFHKGMPEYFRDHGWQVYVVAAPGLRLLEYGDVPAINVQALPMRRNPHPIDDVRSLRSWLEIIRRIQPDAVFVGTPKASLLGILAARMRHVPIRVYHQLGLRLETSKGLKRQVLAAIEKLVVRSSTATIAVSDSLARSLKANGIHGKVSVLGSGSSHGVDTEYFKRREVGQLRPSIRQTLGIEATDIIVGFVGRLNADKGLDMLARAMTELMDRRPELHLVVVGAIDKTNRSNGAFKKHLDRVHEVGYAVDPRPYYEAMDVLALPTFREGMPNVVLEAQSMELPVVTTDATGAIDSIVDGDTGIIVPKHDDVALEKAIDKLISSPSLRADYGREGRARVKREFERFDVWKKHLDYFDIELQLTDHERKRSH